MTQTEWKKIFGDNLASILRDRRMTQTELAQEAGLSVSRVNEYIKGYTAPTIFAIINMAYALDIDVGEFIDFEETIN